MGSRHNATGVASAVDRALRENDALVAAILQHHNAGRHSAAAQLLARLQQNLAYVASVADTYAPISAMQDTPYNLTAPHLHPYQPQLQTAPFPAHQTAPSGSQSHHIQPSSAPLTAQFPHPSLLQSSSQFYPLQPQPQPQPQPVLDQRLLIRDVVRRPSLDVLHPSASPPQAQPTHLQPPIAPNQTTAFAPASVYPPVDRQLPPLLAPREQLYPAPLQPVLPSSTALAPLEPSLSTFPAPTQGQPSQLSSFARPATMLPQSHIEAQADTNAPQTTTSQAPALPVQGQSMPQEQSKYWTRQEHQLFEEGLGLYGSSGKDRKPDLKAIADHIGTRTPIQVRSHLQKHLKRLQKTGASSMSASSSASSPLSSTATLSATAIRGRENPVDRRPEVSTSASESRSTSEHPVSSRAQSTAPRTSSYRVPQDFTHAQHEKKYDNRERLTPLPRDKFTSTDPPRSLAIACSRPLSSPAALQIAESPSAVLSVHTSVPVRPMSEPHGASSSSRGYMLTSLEPSESGAVALREVSAPSQDLPRPRSRSSSGSSPPQSPAK